MSEQLPSDMDALRRLLIEEGGDPNHKTFRERELAARRQAREEAERVKSEDMARRHPWTKMAANVIGRSLEVIAVFFTIVLLLIGTLIGTGLLIVAEILAVSKGFEVIDKDFAGVYAIAAVVFFVVILFIREIIARSATDEEYRMFSLRTMASWLWYTVGFGDHWKQRYKRRASLMRQVDGAVTWLTWTIVLFGLLGRLSDSLEGVTGNWVEGVTHILTESTFSEMLGYIGATVMTVALLLATHFIIFFVHNIFVRVTGGLELANFTSGYSVESFIEIEVTRYYQSQIILLRQRKLQRLEAQHQKALAAPPSMMEAETNPVELPKFEDV